MNSQKTLPDYRAYTVVKKRDQKDIWVSIGAAFQHRDGAGINILLEATPLDGKIVLRPMNEEPNKKTRLGQSAGPRCPADRAIASIFQ